MVFEKILPANFILDKPPKVYLSIGHLNSFKVFFMLLFHLTSQKRLSNPVEHLQ